MEGEEIIELLLRVLILISLLGVFFGWSDQIISTATNLGVSLLAGAITSLIAGHLVEGFTGNILKTIVFPVPVGPFRFSVTGFAIAVFIVGRLIR